MSSKATTNKARMLGVLLIATLIFLGFANWRLSPLTMLSAGFSRWVWTHGLGDPQPAVNPTAFFQTQDREVIMDTPWVRQLLWAKGEEQFIDTSGFGVKDGFQHFKDLAISGQLDFRRPARYPVPVDWVTPMDLEVLKDDPVKNLTTVARAETSLIVLVPWPLDRRAKVGDNITVRVDLKDAEGRQVRTGGHVVRIWLVHENGWVKRSIANDVTDMRNGSFVASFLLRWRGRYEARAALIKSREVHRLQLALTRAMKMTTQMLGVFESEDAEQVTLCSFLPVVPGFLELCNLTDSNFGLPWYCGTPTKLGLRCDHWTMSLYTPLQVIYPDPLVQQLLNLPQYKTTNELRTLQNNVFFSGLGGIDSNPPDSKSCVPLKPRDTWSTPTPSGYWENDEWRPLVGCPLPQPDPAAVRECLRNTSVIVFGDSNGRFLLEHFEAAHHCTRKDDHPTRFAWCKDNNSDLRWIPHAHPFLAGGLGPRARVNEKYAPHYVLDSLPRSGRFVIVIHLFMHYAAMHSYIYALHVRHTVRAVRDLLARNPRVKVLVRGPHAVCGDDFLEFSDYHARRCLAILRHEFRPVMDRVVLLDSWDMTVAKENCGIHPETPVLEALRRMILAHACAAR